MNRKRSSNCSIGWSCLVISQQSQLNSDSLTHSQLIWFNATILTLTKMSFLKSILRPSLLCVPSTSVLPSLFQSPIPGLFQPSPIEINF